MAVAYGGHPGEIAALRALADARGLIAARGRRARRSASRLDGRHVGTFGAAGAFSFFSNKNLAIGEGGAVVTDDDALAERDAAAALARDDDADLGPPPRPRVRLRRRRARLQLPDRRAAGRARAPRGWRGSTPRTARRAGSTCAIASGSPASRTGVDARATGRRRRRAATICSPSCSTSGSTATRVRAALAERGVQTSLHYPPVHRFSIYADGAPELPLTDAYARARDHAAAVRGA